MKFHGRRLDEAPSSPLYRKPFIAVPVPVMGAWVARVRTSVVLEPNLRVKPVTLPRLKMAILLRIRQIRHGRDMTTVVDRRSQRQV